MGEKQSHLLLLGSPCLWNLISELFHVTLKRQCKLIPLQEKDQAKGFYGYTWTWECCLRGDSYPQGIHLDLCKGQWKRWLLCPQTMPTPWVNVQSIGRKNCLKRRLSLHGWSTFIKEDLKHVCWISNNKSHISHLSVS